MVNLWAGATALEIADVTKRDLGNMFIVFSLNCFKLLLNLQYILQKYAC